MERFISMASLISLPKSKLSFEKYAKDESSEELEVSSRSPFLIKISATN